MRPLASVLAFGLAVLAELAAVTLVLGTDSDPAGVRWWLVLLPAGLAALPLAVPVRAVRIGSAAALVIWTVLAGASIGLFFLPATVAALVAVGSAGAGGVRLESDTRDALYTGRSHP